ncbi:MAG: hypothetical protein E6G67_01120 [Actinobacteria bacterium]|nr:MAG: hypothetical protein E6G67_01120 [Actinomycetota bacterium]
MVAAPSEVGNDYFPWSSPTFANGHVYVGVASQCDRPLVRGSLEEFDKATGRLLTTYWTVPPTALGGGIWTSAAVSPGGMVFVTTGNEGSTAEPGDSLSVIRLDESLVPQSRWTVPPAELGKDHDFSSSRRSSVRHSWPGAHGSPSSAPATRTASSTRSGRAA